MKSESSGWHLELLATWSFPRASPHSGSCTASPPNSLPFSKHWLFSPASFPSTFLFLGIADSPTNSCSSFKAHLKHHSLSASTLIPHSGQDTVHLALPWPLPPSVLILLFCNCLLVHLSPWQDGAPLWVPWRQKPSPNFCIPNKAGSWQKWMSMWKKE